MSESKLDCGFDENGNPVLYEIDSAGNRRKVATLLKDGTVKFEPSYENRSEQEKDGFRKAIILCPIK